MATKNPEGLVKAIETADKLWLRGDSEWFDVLATNATVYSVGSVEPFEGRAAYKAHYGPRLKDTRREAVVQQRTIQALDDSSAVVSQALTITEEQIVAHLRQTVVWKQNEAAPNGWYIEHLHTAIIGSAAPASPLTTSRSAIRVLNERIATIAAVLGVAQ